MTITYNIKKSNWTNIYRATDISATPIPVFDRDCRHKSIILTYVDPRNND